MSKGKKKPFNFMLNLDLNDKLASDINWESMTFPDGQPHISFPGFSTRPLTIDERLDGVEITSRISSPADLIKVGLAADVMYTRFANVDLFITYLLGARMDRVIDPDSPFSLRVIAKMIESFNFGHISILDPHSDVAPALLNAFVQSNEHFVRNVLATIRDNDLVVLVAPDAGASKKVEELSKKFNLPILWCSKKRDPETGKLTKFQVHSGHLDKELTYLIVDDICDGGGTFIGLAEQMRLLGATRIELAVTHGIFSKGLPLKGIDHVYTTDSYTGAHSAILPYWVDNVELREVGWDYITVLPYS